MGIPAETEACNAQVLLLPKALLTASNLYLEASRLDLCCMLHLLSCRLRRLLRS